LCGRAKANVLQLCRLVGWVAALLILKKRGFFFSFSVGRFTGLSVFFTMPYNLFIGATL
jgi:hypothetical protein